MRRHAPSWHPDGGSVLALPVGAEGEVVLLERLSWEPTGYLSGEHSQAVNVVAFSPNGGGGGWRAALVLGWKQRGKIGMACSEHSSMRGPGTCSPPRVPRPAVGLCGRYTTGRFPSMPHRVCVFARAPRLFQAFTLALGGKERQLRLMQHAERRHTS